MKTLVFISVLAGILLSSCATLSVTSDHDPSVNFSDYQTFEYYGWEDGSDQVLNDLDKGRIEQAFGDEFAKRGLSQVERNGDLVVTLFVVTEQKTQRTAHTTNFGGGFADYYGYGPGWGWGTGHSTTTFSEYDYEVTNAIMCLKIE